MISAASKQQHLAWRYIELIRSKELQDANATDPTFGGLSVRQSSSDLITDPILKTLAAAMPSAQVPEPIDAHIFMDSVMYPAMQQVTINNTAPGTAAKDAVAAMESVMPQINGS